MADANEKTVLQAPPPQDKAGISPVLFWIVVIALAAGVGGVYFLMNKDLEATQTRFSDALNARIEEQRKKTEDTVADLKKQLNQEIAKAQEATKKLEAAQTTTAADVASLKTDQDKVKATIASVQTDHEKKIADTTSHLASTDQTVNKIDTKVGYLERDINDIKSKLTAINTDITDMKNLSTELKAELRKEQAALEKEFQTVSKKSDITQADLDKLARKTAEFQLKIVNERARSAAKAAMSGDNKKLIELLEAKLTEPKN